MVGPLLVFSLEKCEGKLLSRELLEFLFKRFTLGFIGDEKEISPVQRYFEGGIFKTIQEAKQKWDRDDFITISNKSEHAAATIFFREKEELKEELLKLYPQQRFLQRRNFKCTKCGECCRPLVKVDEEDIQRIEQAGYKREDFLDYGPPDSLQKDVLKQKDDVCMFLKRNGEEFVCTIYDHRPKNCQIYPFYKKIKIEDCVPIYLRKRKPLPEIFS